MTAVIIEKEVARLKTVAQGVHPKANVSVYEWGEAEIEAPDWSTLDLSVLAEDFDLSEVAIEVNWSREVIESVSFTIWVKGCKEQYGKNS